MGSSAPGVGAHTMSRVFPLRRREPTMTTARQIEANRRNALKSTGPRTLRGKSIVSPNAAPHGLDSTSPAIPRLEDPDAWHQHHEATVESLAPVGQVETDLAERVALILWPLRRVARFEQHVTPTARQRSFDDLATRRRPLIPLPDTISPEQARWRLTE